MKLDQMTDDELNSAYADWRIEYEFSGGSEKIERILEILKRERGRRFWASYKRPAKKKGEAADYRARILFMKGRNKAAR